LKIIHVADTHLGKRPKQTRAGIVNQETRPLEDDFYFAWNRIVKDIVEMTEKPDIILHCGDFYDAPSGLDPGSSPPEYARQIATKAFNQLHDAKIPLFILDGNHGRYIQYRSSTLTEYSFAFDNIHLFTYYDLRKALKTQTPLYKDLPDLNLRVIAHPAIEPRLLSALGLYPQYERWVKVQNNAVREDMINVGMAHGMLSNYSLHPSFLSGKYDYIALGDDHKMHRVNDRAWYSGSPQLWSFNEYGETKGYLIVRLDLDRGPPKVTPVKIASARKIISEQINVSSDDTSSAVIDKVKRLLDSHGLLGKYDYNIAARVRISLVGDMTYGASFNISEIDSYLKRLTLEGDSYNVVEFILDSPTYLEPAEVGQIVRANKIEYLLENPEREFRDYINSARSEDIKKQNLDPSLLARIFASVLSKEECLSENT
jgi:DNA repair exonuclease SbcCD nuclease subunit